MPVMPDVPGFRLDLAALSFRSRPLPNLEVAIESHLHEEGTAELPSKRPPSRRFKRSFAEAFPRRQESTRLSIDLQFADCDSVPSAATASSARHAQAQTRKKWAKLRAPTPAVPHRAPELALQSRPRTRLWMPGALSVRADIGKKNMARRRSFGALPSSRRASRAVDIVSSDEELVCLDDEIVILAPKLDSTPGPAVPQSQRRDAENQQTLAATASQLLRPSRSTAARESDKPRRRALCPFRVDHWAQVSPSAVATAKQMPQQRNLAAPPPRSVIGLCRNGPLVGPRPRKEVSAALAQKQVPVLVKDSECRDFVRFMHCQLLKEAEHFFQRQLESDHPPDALMWPKFQKFAFLRTAARVEKWVPFHTCLQDHERFLLTEIHNSRELTPKQQFIAMFIFRAHCREDVFKVAQLGVLKKKQFWMDEQASWAEGGEMDTRLHQYHLQTGKPLQTSAFRIFGKRLKEDRGENLVRNTCERSARLTRVAAEVWDEVLTPFFAKRSTASAKRQLYAELSRRFFAVDGVGPTWVKMLMVCIDHRYPELGLLQSECVVGAGAVGALKHIVTGVGKATSEYALSKLTQTLNGKSRSCPELDRQLIAMKKLLAKVEELARAKYGSNRVIKKHLYVAKTGITAAIVQVQLCEYRQFLEKHAAAGGESVR